MVTTYLGFNILRVTITTKCSRVRQLSRENSRGVRKLTRTLMDIKKKLAIFLFQWVYSLFLFQALNLILLTSSELSDLRDLLKKSLVHAAGKDLFVSLYASWCHSPMAILSLCLVAQVTFQCYFSSVLNYVSISNCLIFLFIFASQTYQHASAVIQSLVEEDINVKFLVQLDKLIRLLETPVFAYLRLQVGMT